MTRVLSNLLSLPLASIFLGVIKIWKFLTWLKVDLVFTILNVMCECVSAALEQVARNRLVYVLGGFGCAVVAIGFAMGELLWMKKKNQNIGILDWLGFLAALSQVSSSGVHVVFVCLHKSSPINFSVFSLTFALVSAYYKIILKSHTHEFVIHCKESFHCKPLKVCEEIPPKKTLFECPLCPCEEMRNFSGSPYIGAWIPVVDLSNPRFVGDSDSLLARIARESMLRMSPFWIPKSNLRLSPFWIPKRKSSALMETKSSFTRKALIILIIRRRFDSLQWVIGFLFFR